VQRLRQQAAARALQRGDVDIPYRCTHCRSTSIRLEDRYYYDCLQCGRRSNNAAVSQQRLEEVREFIVRGINISRPN
jgi:DNA-directed RNA polymerase subunit RPC12/RpoP